MEFGGRVLIAGKVIEYRHDTYQLLSFERGRQQPEAQDYIQAAAIDGLFS